MVVKKYLMLVDCLDALTDQCVSVSVRSAVTFPCGKILVPECCACPSKHGFGWKAILPWEFLEPSTG